MASDVFIAMESNINLEHLLAGSREQVSIMNLLRIMPDEACGIRWLLD